MQSHDDNDSKRGAELSKLFKEAEYLTQEGRNIITAGRIDEDVLCQWEYQGVVVTQRPADRNNILRISIGGGKVDDEEVAYCVFRGEKIQCMSILEKALKALRAVDQRTQSR